MKRALALAGALLVATVILPACRDHAPPAATTAPAPAQRRSEAPRVSERVEKHFGVETWEIVANAERVEVYRIDGSLRGPKPDPTAQLVTGRPVTAGPIAPGADWVRRFRAVLGNERTYGWGFAKGCIPTPGVAVRFIRGDDRVDLWLCYGCRELGMQRYAGAATQPAAGASEDFDAAEDRLVALAKEIFPDDPAIQALPESDGPI